MKKGLFSILFVGAAFSAVAANVNMSGNTDANNPYLWTSTVSNQPWNKGVAPTATDTALWKGYNGGTQVSDGYIAVNTDATIYNFLVSGGGGAGSNLHLVFDSDAYEASSLTIASGSLFSYNSSYALDVFLEGKGTLTASAKSTGWNFDSSNSTARALTIGSGITLNSTVFAITNASQASDASVNVYGTLTASDYITVNHNLQINIKDGGKITPTNAIAMHGTSKLTTDAGSTFSTMGKLKFGETSVGVLNGAVSSTNLEVGDGSAATVSIGGNTVVSATTTQKVNSSLTVATGGTLTTKNLICLSSLESGSTTQIDGILNVGAGYDAKTSSIKIQGLSQTTVGSTGKINMQGGMLTLGFSSPSAGKLELNSTGNVIKNYILGLDGSSITLNASNDIDALIACRGSVPIYVNSGTTEINGLLMVKTTEGGVSVSKTFTIKVANGARLIIDTLAYDGEVTGLDENVAIFSGISNTESFIDINSFLEKTILVKDITDSENYLDQIRISGSKNNNLHFSDYDSTAGGYWLTTVIVPEPAEWAAIFGALALLLAARRRRK